MVHLTHKLVDFVLCTQNIGLTLLFLFLRFLSEVLFLSGLGFFGLSQDPFLFLNFKALLPALLLLLLLGGGLVPLLLKEEIVNGASHG